MRSEFKPVPESQVDRLDVLPVDPRCEPHSFEQRDWATFCCSSALRADRTRIEKNLRRHETFGLQDLTELVPERGHARKLLNVSDRTGVTRLSDLQPASIVFVGSHCLLSRIGDAHPLAWRDLLLSQLRGGSVKWFPETIETHVEGSSNGLRILSVEPTPSQQFTTSG